MNVNTRRVSPTIPLQESKTKSKPGAVAAPPPPESTPAQLNPTDRFERREQQPVKSGTEAPAEPQENTATGRVRRLGQQTGGVKQGVRLEKAQLLAVLNERVSSLSDTQRAASTELHKNQNSLAKKILLGESQNETGELKTYGSLEQAVEAANKRNRGSELIVAVQGEKGVEYALIELKGNATPQEVLATLGDQAEAYITDKNGGLTPVVPENESREAAYQRVSGLAKMAVADNAKGFDRNRAGTQEVDKMPTYRRNLSTVKKQLDHTLQRLDTDMQTAQSELKALEKAGKGNTPEANTLRQDMVTMSRQREDLSTSKTLLTVRLLQTPKSSQQIPNSDLKYGQYRSQPRKLSNILQDRLDQINTKLMVTRDPALRKDLEAQRDQLQKEDMGVYKRYHQIQVAQMHTDMRVGALASMNQKLTQARADLKDQVTELNKAELKLATLKGPELEKQKKHVNYLRKRINDNRKLLIKHLQKDIANYKEHASSRRGAVDAIKLLEKQVDKLKALGAGKEDQLLVTLDNTHELLLESIKDAGNKFIGITPGEVKALLELDTKTDDYISDYIGAQSKIDGLKKEIAQKQALYNDPTMKQTLIGDAQMSALEKAYVKSIQGKIKNAKSGPLAKMKKLYAALEMSKNPNIDADLRKRIDVKAIEAKIAALGKEPEVIKAFADAKKEAMKEVFGDKPAAQELKKHLLSPKFQAYLDLLPEHEKAAILKADLAKLAFADPKAAAEVQEALIGREIQKKSVTILKSLPPGERAGAIEKVLKAMDKPVTGADKTAKVADALAKTFDAMDAKEAKAFEALVDKMRRGDAEAGTKVFDILNKKLDKMGAAGIDAKGFIQRMGNSKKFAGFLTFTAIVGAGGKLPAAIKEGDFNAIGQFGAAAAGAASNTSALVAKMVGFDADSILSDMKKGAGAFKTADTAADLQKATRLGRTAKALKVMEVLGPIGDLAGAGFDFYNASNEFKNGDNFGGAMKVTSGVAGLAGAGASIAIIAGASGPAAPVVLVGATVVGLVAWGADELWGESEEETFLRNLGVLKPK